MCTARLTACRTCHKRWFQLARPCGDGKNMSTCPSFADGKPRSPRHLSTRVVDAAECPVCTPAKSDKDNLRLVKSMTRGVRYGMGPGRDQAGVDVGSGCCGVM